MNYEHRRKKKQIIDRKETKKAVIKDTLDRLNGRVVRPRCPHCHMPLKMIYLSRREWNDDKEIFESRYNGCWCPCGGEVANAVTPYIWGNDDE